MRAAAARKLSEDWVAQIKSQKAEKLGELNIDKLITMFQLRLKWKSAPTFSVWLEVQDPIYRWSWVAHEVLTQPYAPQHKQISVLGHPAMYF